MIGSDKQSLRVLFLEDEMADIELCCWELGRAGFDSQADIVQTRQEYAERLDCEDYDVILADYKLPTWSGLEALEYLEKLGKDIPFILVTGALGEETAAECIKRGAADYILKDRLARLPIAIRCAMRERRLRQERARAEEMVSQLAAIVESSHDAIIGMNLEGCITSWNAGAEILYHYSAREAIGRHISFLGAPEKRDEVSEILERVKDDTRVEQYETIQLERDYQPIHVSLTVSPTKDSTGRIVGISTIARDISERKRLEAQLVRLASHDPLTELLNRRCLLEEVQRQLARSRRHGDRGALLFLDLDQFKDVNDSMGHMAGDQLLVHIGGLLRERMRETDVVARLGGDEFAILLAPADLPQARCVAELLLEALQRHTTVINGQPVGVTASMGIVLLPEHGATPEELFTRADLALYQAKENGRNCVAVYAPERNWQREIELRLGWQKRIREALAKDLFVLDAQPILHLASNQISQHEVLLRLGQEGGPRIAPGAFIDIAERFGLIHEIDRRVVQRAIQFLGQRRTGPGWSRVEVNLSGKAFADPELLPLIARELAAASVRPADLILEVTESAAISCIHEAQKFICTLKELGCQFALDDFGVGFSSFYHLKYLPVDYLKIDGSFIRNLANDPLDQHLVKAMVDVSRGLRKMSVAESVGDAETLSLLRQYGVEYAQGYHIGRPKPL